MAAKPGNSLPRSGAEFLFGLCHHGGAVRVSAPAADHHDHDSARVFRLGGGLAVAAYGNTLLLLPSATSRIDQKSGAG